MKNFKYIAILLTFTLFMGCGEDDVDSITNDGTYSPTSEISVGFTDTNDGLLLLEDGGTADFVVSHSIGALPNDMVVSLSMSSSDGSVEATFPDQVIIPAGQTSVTFTCTLNDDGISGDMEIYTMSISNAVIQGNTDNEYYITTADGFRTMEIADTFPTIITTTPSDVDFDFNWTGASDLDCRIRNAALVTIDVGYSTSPGELVTLGQSNLDGVYTFSIRPWFVTDPTSDYTIDFIYPTGVETFTGTLTLGANFWAEEFTVLEIEKQTSGSTVTYTITEL
jgi:hypothetical protein